jgi:two-component sensor histidine kinase
LLLFFFREAQLARLGWGIAMLGNPKPDVSIVYETDLAARPAPEIDPGIEKTALLELAGIMNDAPANMLPKFVDLAMELTGGISAGLSLLEEDGPEPVFRWHHLRGLLAPFNGATTPRDFSPCGITLDRNAPTLTVHPERVYDWIPEDLSLPEVMLVPLYVGRSEPLGTLWIVGNAVGHFHGGHSKAMQELASFIGVALKMIRAEQDLQASLQQQELLTKEMSHRLKNVFAIIDGMIRISARSTRSKEEMADMLSGRVHALAAAHSLVRRTFSDVQPAASDLADLLRVIVEPHEAANGERKRFSIAGPSVLCGEQAVNGLALVFHELATNAAKYGVLGSESGEVHITWRLQDRDLVIEWFEQGGSGVDNSPASKGFGSTLVDSTVLRQFSGTLAYDWRSDGLTVNISIPIARLEA